MKRALLLLGLLLGFAASAHGQATQISTGPVDPPTCDPTRGLQFYNNSTNTMKYCASLNTWLPFTAAGQTLPNTNVPFNSTPSFDGSTNHAYSMTLTGNVTSSTITGNPQNGTLLAFNLCQDGTGGRTFSFPVNFTLGGFTFLTGANICNYLTFKFDGVNWTLVSSGGGGGGGTPAGATGNLQLNNGGAFGVGGENDNGTVFSTTRDAQFAGPNPYIDIRAFGARIGLGFFTTASITSGTNTATLASASSFINGDGVTITGAGPTPTMATPSAPSVSAANANLLPGTGNNVANASGATTYQYQIAAIDALGGVTIASAAASIANGAASLGQQSVNVASWTRSNNIVTVTTSSPHNLVVNSLVSITGDNFIAGTYQTVTVADNTHFTFQTAQDTRNSAPTIGGGGGVVIYWTCNHITWSAVAGAWKYIIFGRTAGSMLRIGESLPETSVSSLHTDPLYNTFDDFGATMSAQSGEPFWYPNTPPVAVKNQDLITTITSGAGTVNVVLANNAGNTVVGASAQSGNDVAFLTAAKAASGMTGSNPGILFIPETPTNQSYFTTSVLNLTTFPQKLGIIQAGTFFPADTVILGNGTWTGSPNIPLDSPSFGWENYPKIIISGNPGFYTTNSGSVMSYVSLTNNVGNQALLYLADTGGIPASRWEHMNFATVAANDCMGRHLIIRNNIAGAANYTLAYTTMAPGNCSVASFAPLFQHTQNGGSPFTLDHVFLNRRGMYWGGGFQGTIDNVYEQGATMPKLFFANTTAGLGTLAVDIRNSIEDTTGQPIVTYTTFQTGLIRIFGSNGIPNGVQVNGPGGVTVSFEGSGAVSALYGQNTFSKIGPVVGGAIDGRISTAGGNNYSETLFNMGLSLGAPYKLFVNSVAQVAPTCVVSAGGSVVVGSYNFTVAPVFPDGSEGTMSQQSPTCTTTGGNQVITINWTVVPGATGYDLYRNGFSFQCTPPWVAGGASTSYVWSGTSPCGQGAPPLTGGGPVDILGNTIVSPAYVLTAGNGGGFAAIGMPTATAPSRNITVPDASGVLQLVPTTGNIVLAPLNGGFIPSALVMANGNGQLVSNAAPMSVYDSFTRANGLISAGVGTDWTVSQGTVNISSNSVIGTGSQASAVYTGRTWPFDDMTVTATVGSAPLSGNMNVIARSSLNGLNFYTCTAGIGFLLTQRQVAGVYTTLPNQSGYSVVAGDVLSINTKGTTISCYVNGKLLFSNTDANIAPGGYPGVYWFGASSGSFTNFTASYGAVSLAQPQTWSQIQTYTPGLIANGTVDFSGATLVKGRVGAGLTTTVNGDFGYDTTNKNWHFWTNAADKIAGIWSATPTTGNCVQANVVASVVSLVDSGTTNCGGTGAWSALTNATGNLTLANAGFSTTFNQTSAVNWTWANITAATNVTSQSSPIMNYCGTYWTGAASAADCWLIEGVVANGTNGTSVLTFTHTGSSGTASESFPGAASFGTTPINCGAGVTGCVSLNEASTAAGNSGTDTIRGDSVNHRLMVNENNVAEMALTKTFNVNVTPVTANANVTTDQNLMAATIPANVLNIVGRTLRVQIAGLFSTAAASTATLTFKLKLCTVSGCASGTVVNLTNIGTAALGGISASNNPFNEEFYVATQAAGATASFEAHGNLTVDTATPVAGVADAVYTDTNSSTVGTIDTTGQLFLQVTGAFSAASASNSLSQRQMTIEILN